MQAPTAPQRTVGITKPPAAVTGRVPALVPPQPGTSSKTPTTPSHNGEVSGKMSVNPQMLNVIFE